MRFGWFMGLGVLSTVTLSCSNDVQLADKDTAPQVAFTWPADQSNFGALDTIDLQGTITDGDGLSDIVTWSFASDRDGVLVESGEVPADQVVRFSTTLSPGVHSVTLYAVDTAGLEATDAITIVVESPDEAPTATISSPDNLDVLLVGEPIALFGIVADPNDPSEDLLTVWTVESADGSSGLEEIARLDADADGATEASWTPTELGPFRFGLEVVDPDGNDDLHEILVEIVSELPIDLDGDGALGGENGDDCNDDDATVFPGAPELCNGVDDDCDGTIDDKDDDTDFHVDLACAGTYDGPLPPDDCDDQNAFSHPGAPETQDGIDNDCSGQIDEGTDAWDVDGDCVCPDAVDCFGSENPICVSLSTGDCDDDDVSNYPGNLEICDRADNDCDGDEDDGVPTDPYWPDADGDGFGSDSSLPVRTCDGAPANHVPDDTDCDDGELGVNPGAVELSCDGADNDCDPATIDGPDADGDGATTCDDCNDADPENFPGNAESCDQLDNDCDGLVDDDVENRPFWVDADGDGFGNPALAEVIACTRPPGRAPNNDDCDDTDDLVSPDEVEATCDDVDNDCNQTTLDAPDADGDGVTLCDADCDDADALNYPGSVELCDGADNNCNGIVDDGPVPVTYHTDADDDGHGDPNGPTVVTCTAAPIGYAAPGDDCDDADPDNFPTNPEVCDDADNDCDGDIDNGLLFVRYWPDLDGDGYGNRAAVDIATCDGPPLGVPRVTNNEDCNDLSATVNPGELEVTCDNVDNDCLPATDDTPDDDGDGIASCSDCDDGDPANFPANPEICDGGDNDCDNLVDDGLAFVTYFLDNDGDGFGSPLLAGVRTCDGAPPNRVANDDDCNDADGDTNPSADEITCDNVDNDCAVATRDAPDGDADGSSVCVDCDDGDASNRPGGGEVCDGRDNDCDSVADDGLFFVDFYPDDDDDGFGADDAPAVRSCSGAPAGHVSNRLDCDDDADDNFPTNPEVCDDRDNDCNGAVDNGLVFTDWYPDNDSDNFGSALVAGTRSCDGAPFPGFVTDHTDCNDATATTFPGAPEVPVDGIDADCDGADDCRLDADDDGVGVPAVVSGTTLTCTGPNESATSNDCDDADALNFPGNVELCDGLDNNCSGVADENQTFVDYYPDADADGFGSSTGTAQSTCTGAPPGRVANRTDCDDTRATVNPGRTEVTCNTLNDDCVATTLDAPDGDGDGSTVCSDCNDGNDDNFPGNPEVCDGFDNDCDTVADDGLVVRTTWVDADGDGWGDPSSTPQSGCGGIPTGRVDNDLDCDDTDADLNQDDLDSDSFSTCDDDCDDDDDDIFPGETDVPDRNFVDSNCDGIDGDEDIAVFVATNGSDVNNLVCTRTQPCRTIEHAQTVAETLDLGHVYIRTGTYTGGVNLRDGIDLFGGYSTTWERDDNTLAAHNVTLQGGFVAADGEYITVRARNVDGGLHDLQIDGPVAVGTVNGNGRSSYAIHAENSTLTLDRLDVNQGSGAPGTAGTSGSSASQVAAAPATGRNGAGGGGTQVCSESRPAGGVGGTNASCTNTGGGTGGQGGTSDTNCNSFGVCFGGDCNARAGLAGTDGAQATSTGPGDNGGAGNTCTDGGNGRDGRITNGAAGTGGTSGGLLAGVRSAFWYGKKGTNGVDGVTGGGGGGAGGGGGCDSGAVGNYKGGAGGGGGAGGCIGNGGTGGGAGGSSFGVFSYQSVVVATDCHFERAAAGAGAAGGQGGNGQPGGLGGTGGPGGFESIVGGTAGGDGGLGGDGGHGGHGGGGGGGAGGHSLSFYNFGGTVTRVTPTGAGGTAGAGGAGGVSSPAWADGNNGTSGGAGTVGLTGTCAAPGGC